LHYTNQIRREYQEADSHSGKVLCSQHAQVRMSRSQKQRNIKAATKYAFST
jgi:hypothetical protein